MLTAASCILIMALDHIRVFSRFGVFTEILTAYEALKLLNDY